MGAFMAKKQAINHINGFDVRPGNYLMNGSFRVSGGVNFTIHSVHAVGCELVLFKPMEKEPFAVIPFSGHLPDRKYFLHGGIRTEH